MNTNVILTNKRRTYAQSNYASTKLKAWFRCLLRHPARKWSVPILHPWTHKRGMTDKRTISDDPLAHFDGFVMLATSAFYIRFTHQASQCRRQLPALNITH